VVLLVIGLLIYPFWRDVGDILILAGVIYMLARMAQLYIMDRPVKWERRGQTKFIN
jgi:hypothetical protein